MKIKSRNNQKVDVPRLLETVNAVVWAEEFAKCHPEIDQGEMISWFANLACVAEDLTRAKCREVLNVTCST